jgi:hypothetical protein
MGGAFSSTSVFLLTYGLVQWCASKCKRVRVIKSLRRFVSLKAFRTRNNLGIGEAWCDCQLHLSLTLSALYCGDRLERPSCTIFVTSTWARVAGCATTGSGCGSEMRGG